MDLDQSGATIAHLGGDEFVIALDNPSFEDVVARSKALIHTFSQPLMLNQQGRNQYQFYLSTFNSELQNRLSLVH